MSETFQKEFAQLRELGEEAFVLRGSTIIVEILPPEEIKTESGIIIATPDSHRQGSAASHKVDVGRVLMCGQGYFVDPDPETSDKAHYEELEVKPGAIVLLPQYSSQFLSHFPGIQRPTANKLAMIKMDNVLAYYPSEEAYLKAKAKLNG